MPFYSSLAYSLGAALARKTPGYADFKDKRRFLAAAIAGAIILAAFLIDLVISIRQSQGGWHSNYLLLAATPLGVGALLLYVGVILRPKPVSQA